MISLVLQLDSSGQPNKWISWKKSIRYYDKKLVAWELGEHKTTVHGGINAQSCCRSVIVISSIIAVKGKLGRRRHHIPCLNNKELFRRDRHMCAYCGRIAGDAGLTRDHILPISRGGDDTWTNCVTCCLTCNTHKGCHTPEEAGLKLLYVPFVPSRIEHLLLQNRGMLQEQIEFLLTFIPEHSFIREILH